MPGMLDAPPTAPSLGWRDADWRRLGAERFDVLVVGGGINGAAIARDAAMRGLRTALVEARDFGWGTSSRSSRLVHGGVRYLEHGWFHLVFEASRERRILLAQAPSLVRPLEFTWPVYADARIPRWQQAAGLWLYDLLALFRNVGRHRPLSKAGVLASEPGLTPHGLRGGATYFDAATSDVGLTLANALDAAGRGAVVLNHAAVEGLVREGTRIVGARVRDARTGAVAEVRAGVVVNAAGPWSDAVRRLADPAVPHGVRGAKGVHVLVPRERVGNRGALTILAPQDGRVMFVLPAGDFAMLGTTDTYTADDPAEVRADEGDVAYLLAAVNAHFPAARLGRDDVVSAWAGIRPLVASAAAGRPSDASREHELVSDVPGLLSITGGKLTTYRSMAAQVVDAAVRALGVPAGPCRTADLPLALPPRADDAPAGDGDRRIVPDRPYTLAEADHAVAHERVVTLGDLLVRRLPIAFETRDHGRAAAARLAPRLAARLGWDAEGTSRALADYEEEARRLFAIDGAPVGEGGAGGERAR